MLPNNQWTFVTSNIREKQISKQLLTSLKNLWNVIVLILEVTISEKNLLCISFCIDFKLKKFITNLLLPRYPISQLNKKLKKKKKREEGIINEQCQKTHYKGHENENTLFFCDLDSKGSKMLIFPLCSHVPYS